MSKKDKIQAHKKVSNKHTTVTDLTKELIIYLKDIPELNKISISLIKHTGTKNKKIKYTKIKGALKVLITGNGAIQYIYVYSDRLDIISSKIDVFASKMA